MKDVQSTTSETLDDHCMYYCCIWQLYVL